MASLAIDIGKTGNLCVNLEFIGKSRKTVIIPAIIDTGAQNSYLGIDYITSLGYLIKDLPKKLMAMYGITGENHEYPRNFPKVPEKIYAAHRLEIESIKFDSTIKVDKPTVCIPISCIVAKKALENKRFERTNFALIGMDVLQFLNFGINIEVENEPYFVYSIPKRKIIPTETNPRFVKFYS